MTTGKDLRNQAQNINFGILYGRGSSALRIGRRAGMSMDIHMKTALDMFTNFPWSSFGRPLPDFPGGAKKFCHLLNTWTRDLRGPHGLRHVFIQKGQNIACAMCQTSVASFCSDNYPPEVAQEKNKPRHRRAFTPYPGPRIRNRKGKSLSPHHLRGAMRKIVETMGPCETRIVRNVMER